MMWPSSRTRIPPSGSALVMSPRIVPQCQNVRPPASRCRRIRRTPCTRQSWRLSFRPRRRHCNWPSSSSRRGLATSLTEPSTHRPEGGRLVRSRGPGDVRRAHTPSRTGCQAAAVSDLHRQRKRRGGRTNVLRPPWSTICITGPRISSIGSSRGLKIAKAHNLTIPPSLLQRADEVIV